MPSVIDYIDSPFRSPTVNEDEESFWYKDADFNDYIGESITPGSTLTSAPTFFSWGLIRPIEVYNVYINMATSGSNAQAWEFHMQPAEPVVFSSKMIVPVGLSTLDITKVVKVTHPLNSNNVELVISVDTQGLESDASNSGVIVEGEGAARNSLVGTYVMFAFKNVAAADTYTIDDMRVWGSYKR